MRSLLSFAAVVTLAGSTCLAQATLDLHTAQVRLDAQGRVTAVAFADGASWAGGGPPAFVLETASGPHLAQSVSQSADRLTVTFDGGAKAEFRVAVQPSFAVLELVKIDSPEPPQRLQLFSLAAPADARINPTLNAAESGGRTVALMTAEPGVFVRSGSFGVTRGDRAGCSHEFIPAAEAQVGKTAARFTATCNEQPGGWAVQGRTLPRPLDLAGLRAVRLWVHGDGQGQALKVQLADGQGGYRDDYLPIDFTGWRQVTLATPSLNTLRPERVTAVNFYYNSQPPGKTVTCLLDQVEALVGTEGAERVVVLEDFEDPASPLWGTEVRTLSVETTAAHGITPARFGLVVCPAEKFLDILPDFEVAAGLPSPRPGGVWNKRSPWIRRSYLFLTNFGEAEFDAGLALARAGGFDMILLGQESWCESTGHYEVNRKHFPDGLEGLVRTVRRFKEAGFKVGLHFLGASVYPPDPYLTPVPDPRLVTGAAVELAADVDAAATFLPTAAAPSEFPAEDGGYMGKGTVLRIGDELITYGDRALEPPYGFKNCHRGHLGTKAAAHRAGEKVVHLVRSYGYHMVDLDTSLRDEVAAHLARVANACDVDMLYFDGSELLQGDHSYYNARLIQGYYEKLQRKDILLQASSYSPYSWHILARTASADGHGDLKGYLDERSPWFGSYARGGMPLDIGWYYGYDPSATPDMYEYVLGATVGYDSSMSFQVSPAAAARHPFTPEILDLIARYERLRLSGRVPPEMRERLRIDSILAKPDEAERAKVVDHRREYRLLGEEGQEVFQRVIYGPWREVNRADEAARSWTFELKEGPARVGVQFQTLGGAWLQAGPAYDAPDAVVLETFDDVAPYAGKPAGPVRAIAHGQAGATLPGVTQRLELAADDPRAGRNYAVYAAESRRGEPDGWSVIGKQFDPPLDLSQHRGIGFWLRGDGRGGSFKLQLLDGRAAQDYYVANDYTGWRYQQLPRPEKDPIDYSRVRTLNFYYNGLPARTAVACGIDDVKALMRLDTLRLAEPAVEIAGQRLGAAVTLEQGQYLILWPGESLRRHAAGQRDDLAGGADVSTVTLPAGTHTARFHCAPGPVPPVRVRLTFQPEERYALP